MYPMVSGECFSPPTSDLGRSSLHLPSLASAPAYKTKQRECRPHPSFPACFFNLKISSTSLSSMDATTTQPGTGIYPTRSPTRGGGSTAQTGGVIPVNSVGYEVFLLSIFSPLLFTFVLNSLPKRRNQLAKNSIEESKGISWTERKTFTLVDICATAYPNIQKEIEEYEFFM